MSNGNEQLVLDAWPTGDGDDSVAVAECEPPTYDQQDDPHNGALDDIGPDEQE